MKRKFRPHQTVVVAGRLPGDPEEYYEVASVEGPTVFVRKWMPYPGCFDEFVRPIPATDILRIASPHDRMPVLAKEPKHETACV